MPAQPYENQNINTGNTIFTKIMDRLRCLFCHCYNVCRDKIFIKYFDILRKIVMKMTGKIEKRGRKQTARSIQLVALK